jgi:2-succinyl-5-enolpyruvyl-6-hydroxy-3-cyclohexene-1-carboxylate synthase
MSISARNTWAGRVIVEELARLGTPLVCLAPGARCAPLSIALGATDRLPWSLFVDERAAAFHALGCGRATGRPAAVVTTSGTAVGNLVPSAMEADSAGVPLLLLTADRPAELRQTGSNQTVRQSAILSPLVRHHLDLPVSDPALSMSALLSALDHAVHMATVRRGPVHLNLQFREPLDPTETPVPDDIAAWWAEAARPQWSAPQAARQVPSSAARARLAELAACRRGLVVVGSLPRGARRGIAQAVATLGWPSYVAPDAGLPVGDRGLDLALSDPELAERLVPDTVLWIGGHIVSKRIVTWLRTRAARAHVVSIRDQHDRIDPAFRVRERIVLDHEALPSHLPAGAPDPDWVRMGRDVHDVTTEVLARAMASWNELSAMRQVLRASDACFVGASLPIRLADWVGADGHPVEIAANRGASGIDGVFSTATGWARHLEGRRRVVVGDLTGLHDQGALPGIREHGLQAVVFNNQGGSIFGLLPFEAVQGFDAVFRNAHDRSLAPLAAAHGLRTAVVADPDGLDAALADAEVDFIEARFEHDATLGALRQLRSATCAALRQAWGLP